MMMAASTSVQMKQMIHYNNGRYIIVAMYNRWCCLRGCMDLCYSNDPHKPVCVYEPENETVLFAADFWCFWAQSKVISRGFSQACLILMQNTIFTL